MEISALLSALHLAEKLKGTTRHCDTSGGRRESVADHSWRLALMAYWISDEFPQADMNKVIKMCLIHDLGECFTGDIPVFRKTPADEDREEALLFAWVETQTTAQLLQEDGQRLCRAKKEHRVNGRNINTFVENINHKEVVYFAFSQLTIQFQSLLVIIRGEVGRFQSCSAEFISHVVGVSLCGAEA